MAYSSLTGDPAKGAVPAGEYNVLEMLLGEFEAMVGYKVEPTNAQLLAMANAGVMTSRDFGEWMFSHGGDKANPILASMPWAQYGLSKDDYISAASIYATEYKKVTGQDISPQALAQAFQNPFDKTGGLLSGTQYLQQLMNDAAIQKQFGWVKYGLDFASWSQQKLQLRTAYGRDINDSEAATILQYTRTSSGANMSAVERPAQQGQQSSGAASGLSIVR